MHISYIRPHFINNINNIIVDNNVVKHCVLVNSTGQLISHEL